MHASTANEAFFLTSSSAWFYQKLYVANCLITSHANGQEHKPMKGTSFICQTVHANVSDRMQ